LVTTFEGQKSENTLVEMIAAGGPSLIAVALVREHSSSGHYLLAFQEVDK